MIRIIAFLRQTWALSWQADRRATMTLTVLLISGSGVAAGIGLSQRWLVDAAPMGHIPAIVGAVVLGAVGFTLRGVGGSTAGPMRVYLMERVNVGFTDRVLAALGAIPTLSAIEEPGHLDRIDRLRRGSAAMSTSLWSFVGTMSAVLSLLSSIVLLASVHPLVCLLAVLAVPPLLAGSRASRVSRDARDAAAEAQRNEQELHELCMRPESAADLLLSRSAQQVSERAEVLWREVTIREARGQLTGLVWQVAGWCVYASGYLVALWVVISLVRQGATSLGAAVMVISLATSLQGQISAVVWNARRVADAGHIAEHYRWLLDLVAKQPAGNAAVPQRLVDGIELRNVKFRYPGSKLNVIDGIDLRLEAGRTVAVVGPNGAGKTTLVKLLTGLYEPTEGEILVNGVPLSTINPAMWRARLSGVFQDFGRYQFKVMQNVGIGDIERITDSASVRGALRLAGMETTHLPNGLDTQLGIEFGGMEPSVGQWQKLALARAQMRSSPLLVVLDEPTAALDPQIEHDTFERFDGYARAAADDHGTIRLLISHRFSTVRTADLIVVVDEGRVVENGTHQQLMSCNGIYAHAYRLQSAAYATDYGHH